jgi:hypothetical protein
MKKAPLSASLFSNPELSDRELMLLVLYEITRLRADVKTALKMVAKINPDVAAQVSKFAVLSDEQAFAELAEDIRQFQSRRQNPPAN